MAVGNLVSIDFETGDLSQWDATSGSPAVTSATPIEGTYSLLTTSNAHVTKNFTASNAVYWLLEIQYAAYPTATRNIAALRHSSGELLSLRVNSTGRLVLQIAAGVLYTTTGALGAGVVSVLVYANRSTGDVELWVRTPPTWTSLYASTGNAFSNDFSAVRVGGLNSGHDGTHRTDWVQVGTNSDILPHNEQPTGIANRIAPTRLTGRLGGLIA